MTSTRKATREEWLAATYDRCRDALDATRQLLDRAPKGRDDAGHPDWPRLHDEY